MRSNFWMPTVTDPQRNINILTILDSLYSGSDATYFSTALLSFLTADDQLTFLPLDSVISPTLFVKWGTEAAIFCAGTSGTIHVSGLIRAWTLRDGTNMASGICQQLDNAARNIINRLPVGWFLNLSTLYLCGHSYGGGVVQGIALNMPPQTPRTRIRIVSYGSLRPGNRGAQSRLSVLENIRYWAQRDPVRYMPPHTTEVPSLNYLLPVALTRGMDSQVQAPEGVELLDNGIQNFAEGNPVSDVGVSVSLLDWVADQSGFRSVYHSVSNYSHLFALSIAYPAVLTPPTSRPRMEQPEILTARQRIAAERVGELELIRDATNPLGVTLNAPIIRPLPGSNLRYQRRRFGQVWAVEYDGAVVAIGPGKRQAGVMARRFNLTGQR